MKVKTETVVTLEDGTEVRAWHTVLVGARGLYEAAHANRGVVYQELEDLDRELCRVTDGKGHTLRTSTRAASAIRAYLADTVRWFEEQSARSFASNDQARQRHQLWHDMLDFQLKGRE